MGAVSPGVAAGFDDPPHAAASTIADSVAGNLKDIC